MSRPTARKSRRCAAGTTGGTAASSRSLVRGATAVAPTAVPTYSLNATVAAAPAFHRPNRERSQPGSSSSAPCGRSSWTRFTRGAEPASAIHRGSRTISVTTTSGRRARIRRTARANSGQVPGVFGRGSRTHS